MSKPVWVQVYWSEAGAFKDGEIYEFKEFEIIANMAACTVKTGYDKTKIRVLFDDGKEYNCRLDLSIVGDRGFTHQCNSFMIWFDNQSWSDGNCKSDYIELYCFISMIKW